MNPVDSLLNKFTMYRVVEYGLIALIIYSIVISTLGQLSFPFYDLLTTLVTVTFTCYFSNLLFAKLFKVPANAESSLITAFILYFLLWPSHEFYNLLIASFVSVIAMLSKYVIAYKHKHIFNPAAFGVVFLAVMNAGALWWIGTTSMLAITTVVGLLIVRKIRKFTMFLTFLLVTTLWFVFQIISRGLPVVPEILQFFTSFPVIFFGTVMLTEPLTAPPTKFLQMVYASIAGILFSWQGSFGPVILTTELTLVVANVFSFVVSPKYHLRLQFCEKRKLANDTFEFVFKKPTNFHFKPGQYMEWTLPTWKTDGRGNRRYFTIASSPSESDIRLGIRFNSPASSFKAFLLNMNPSIHLLAGGLSGDFTLPQDPKKDLVFIAGGIGVTPFRSMIKHMMDSGEKRNIVFFYSNKTADEIAYKDLFEEAVKKIKLQIIYTLTDEENIPSGWRGERGRITGEIIKKYVPQISKTTFFLSGPNAMVVGFKKTLRGLNIKPTSIVTDYFPGF